MDFKTLEQHIGYSFKNSDFLREALTHRSYLNENPGWGLPNNERLEFLGDAVLELVSTEALFNRFPEEQEGKLTALRAALVNYVMLAAIAREIGLEKYLLLSRGELKDTGRAREVILANAIEAFIGAIYLDGGYKAAQTFIESCVLSHLEEVLKHELYIDAKSLLQERAQAEFKITPQYEVISAAGPDHRKTFIIGVYFSGKLIAQGEGFSKQDAEVEAAKKALELLKEGKITKDL